MIWIARRHRPLQVSFTLALLATVACARGGGTGFSEARARAHVRMLADTIGCRPAGSEANRRAREYVTGQLRRLGFEVRVQEADASRPEAGLTTHVFNIVAVRRGSSPDAVALVTHYDSPPESVGAADDGLGVAVLIEAARVLAERGSARWTLVAAVTDAEELGLMGAAALVHDPAMGQVQAYINVEAVGTTGPSLLFQTGPGNAWLVKTWAAAAPSPAGNSITTEIYERLPNDTDFTIIRRLGIPGLNFAPVGYSEAYHTLRDTTANLSQRTLQTTGDNLVAIVRALDGVDIRQRAPGEHATYFDLAERVAVVYGPRTTAIVAWLAVAFGLIAWLKMLAGGHRAAGLARLLLGFAWAVAGVALVALAMTGTVWVLRSTTGFLHPWYAKPGLFLVLLLGSGLLAWWVVVRLAALLPAGARGCAEPVCLWAVVLPLWVALTAVAQLLAPGAGFAVAWPLLTAALGLVAVPARAGSAVRLVSLAALVVGVLLTLPSAMRLLFFASPMFGRLPVVMPVFVYPALMLVFAVPLVPPLLAAMPAGARRRLSSGRTGVALALLVGGALVGSWGLAGYSEARPQLRAARYINMAATPGAAQVEYWEVGANERMPNRDLLPGHPGTGAWRQADDRPPVDFPIGRLWRAHVARLERPASHEFPGTVISGLQRSPSGRVEFTVTVVPASRTATVTLVLRAGVTPGSSNFPGRVVDGRWRASYVAAPARGVEFRLGLANLESAAGAQVAILDRGLPGGMGWQALPSWLPQEQNAWTARSVFVAGVKTEAVR